MHPQSNLRISYDVLDIVINQLGSEQRYNELNACSQTCQMLLHPCRIHLFARISVNENALQFVALLKKNSTVPKYIQELTYRPYVTSGDLASAFLLLHNIKTLYFHGRYGCNHWTSLPPPMQHALAQLFSSPSMTRVCIYDFDNLPATLLSSCLTLKHLTLTACKIFPRHVYDDTLGSPPQLLSLDLLNYHLLDAAQELPEMRRATGLPILDLSSLQSLAIRISDIRQENHLDNILHLTPKLNYLHCSVFQGMTPDSWTQKLVIVLPTLRSLRLTWDAYGAPTELAFLGLIKILEALTYQPNYIKELFLVLLTNRSHANRHVLLDLNWDMLDQVLTDRSGFPQLEKVTIHLCSRSRCDCEKLKEWIEARFEETKTTKFSRLFLAANDYLNFKFEVRD